MIAQHRNPCAPALSRTIPVTVGRLAFLPLLFFLVPSYPGGALGKGGTNMHELSNSRRATPSYEPTLPSETFGGCGRGRYRDPRTRKCRGPADLSNWRLDWRKRGLL
jgi:hypothetical protein